MRLQRLVRNGVSDGERQEKGPASHLGAVDVNPDDRSTKAGEDKHEDCRNMDAQLGDVAHLGQRDVPDQYLVRRMKPMGSSMANRVTTIATKGSLGLLELTHTTSGVRGYQERSGAAPSIRRWQTLTAAGGS